MDEYDLNPFIWFTERKLDFPLPHFIPSRSPLSKESRDWIITYAQGRFSFLEYLPDSENLGGSLLGVWSLEDEFHSYPYFEDPHDAVMYELKWSS